MKQEWCTIGAGHISESHACLQLKERISLLNYKKANIFSQFLLDILDKGKGDIGYTDITHLYTFVSLN